MKQRVTVLEARETKLVAQNTALRTGGQKLLKEYDDMQADLAAGKLGSANEKKALAAKLVADQKAASLERQEAALQNRAAEQAQQLNSMAAEMAKLKAQNAALQVAIQAKSKKAE